MRKLETACVALCLLAGAGCGRRSSFENACSSIVPGTEWKDVNASLSRFMTDPAHDSGPAGPSANATDVWRIGQATLGTWGVSNDLACSVVFDAQGRAVSASTIFNR